MSEKRRAEKDFPLLRPYLADGDLEKLQKIDPLFWGELERLRNFTEMVLRARRRKKRIKVITHALRETFRARGKDVDLYRMLLRALKDAQEFTRYLISKIPPNLRGALESEGEIAGEEDFIALLEKRRRFLGQEDLMSRMREFEARRLISFAIIFFELDLFSEALHLNGASSQNVTAFLENRFFDRDCSRRVTLIAFHNQENAFRVESWYFKHEKPQDFIEPKGSFVKKEYEFVCRQFSWNGQAYFAYYRCRDKDLFSHFLKMLRKDVRDSRSSLLDWRGVKFVFFDQEAMVAALDKLRYEVFYFPGVTWKLEDGRYFRETDNVFSAKTFRAKKFVRLLGGEPLEVIVETAVNHLNGSESRGEESHALYRLRQLVRSALLLVFPEEIYGINWQEREEEITEFNSNN